MTTTKTDAEWREQLSDIEYRVTREAAKSRLRRARTLVREYMLGTKDSGREST